MAGRRRSSQAKLPVRPKTPKESKESNDTKEKEELKESKDSEDTKERKEVEEIKAMERSREGEDVELFGEEGGEKKGKEGKEEEDEWIDEFEVDEEIMDGALKTDEGLSPDGPEREEWLRGSRSAEEHDVVTIDGEGEEGREPRRLTTPPRISAKEREDHELTHTPFRSWCPYCMKGRSIKKAHKKVSEVEDEEMKVPRVSMDYFYLSQKDEDAKENPVLVVVNEKTGEKFARAAGRKGVGEGKERDWLIKEVSEEMKVGAMQEVKKVRSS